MGLPQASRSRSGHGTVTTVRTWLTWREATSGALYGKGGFFREGTGPAAHFRTSVHASPLFAEAMLRLLDEVDAALDRPETLDLVDVGAGRGELLQEVLDRAGPSLRPRLRLHAVELTDRPEHLREEIAWTPEIPKRVSGLLVANEWLDDVPVDIAQRTENGVRLVLVDPATGEERPGGPLSLEDQLWLAAWWPLDVGEAGDRAEIGRPRDEAWASAVTCVEAGLAIAIDYSHSLADRAMGLLPAGTLTGYRNGRAVVPRPDGTCDVTCHVALDACAVAGEAAGASETTILSQREALHALGITAPHPDATLARTDPGAYLAALDVTSQAAELTARGGFGDFGWLVQSVAMPLPASLAPAQ
jgi:SAM-dependent MidA family methyltransferase